MAGAPLGNQNAAAGKKWKAAIDRALETRSRVEGKEILDELANQLITQALAGEQWALKEFGDRMDGKPVIHAEQKHEHRLAESLSEEHARLVAEGFLESLRSSQGDSAKEPDRLHNNIQT